MYFKKNLELIMIFSQRCPHWCFFEFSINYFICICSFICTQMFAKKLPSISLQFWDVRCAPGTGHLLDSITVIINRILVIKHAGRRRTSSYLSSANRRDAIVNPSRLCDPDCDRRRRSVRAIPTTVVVMTIITIIYCIFVHTCAVTPVPNMNTVLSSSRDFPGWRLHGFPDTCRLDKPFGKFPHHFSVAYNSTINLKYSFVAHM